VAKQFVGGLGAGVGLITGLVGGNGFDDFFGGAAFVFQCAEKNVV
jgi:hypothetical protein